MAFRPHIYGAPSGVTKETLQKSSRPAPWANYVASGNLSTQEVYDSKENILARYDAAVAAAGVHDIVTLTAQTDGSTIPAPGEQILTLPVSPHVSDNTAISLYARGIVFRADVFTPEMLGLARLALGVPAAAVNWTWYGAASPLNEETELTFIQDATLTSGSVELPNDAPYLAYPLLLLAPRVSPQPATYGELLSSTQPVMFSAFPATVENAEAIGARLIGEAGVPAVRVVVGGPHLGGTEISAAQMQFTVSPTMAGQLTRLELGIAYSGGALLRTAQSSGVRITLTQGVATLAYPLPAGETTLILTLDNETDFPTTADPAGASVPAGSIGIGISPYLVRYAGAQSIRCTITRAETFVPCYTGTITTTSYVPGEDTELTAEGQLRPTSRVTVSTARSVEKRTVNNQDGWPALKKMAYEAAYNGQTMFPFFLGWESVWDHITEGELALPVEHEEEVVTLSATYTWFSTSASASEAPPDVTPLYPYKRPGSAEPVDGYAEQWYRHTLTYTNQA